MRTKNKQKAVEYRPKGAEFGLRPGQKVLPHKNKDRRRLNTSQIMREAK